MMSPVNFNVRTEHEDMTWSNDLGDPSSAEYQQKKIEYCNAASVTTVCVPVIMSYYITLVYESICLNVRYIDPTIVEIKRPYESMAYCSIGHLNINKVAFTLKAPTFHVNPDIWDNMPTLRL